MPGTLYLVPTPIGNLGDMSFRAIEVLKAVNRIACEDTRTSGVLLKHYGIATPTVSFHKFNERSRSNELVGNLKSGLDIAVITDAGTPGISDPAFFLVRLAVEAGIEVYPLPGPTAFLPALTASGLPPQPFLFIGFPPEKPGDLRRLTEGVRSTPATLVFYESPHRFRASLGVLRETLGERRAVIARELTKMFQSFYRGTLGELMIADVPEKGEFVLLVEGALPEPASDDELRIMLGEQVKQGHSLKDAAKIVAATTGERVNRLYRLGIDPEKNLAGDNE
jgi:16S rRNA (cytidine1402-2'-O)-methyltransferase